MPVKDWTPSERLPLASLHQRFGDGLRDKLITDLSATDLASKPLELRCKAPLPPQLCVYLFNCTDHPSERRAGDYRIQLRVPGQKPRERGWLKQQPGSLLLLGGYVTEFDVFVFWDANAHQGFPNSKGIQVAASTIHMAAIRGIAEQARGLRAGGHAERVVAARGDRLIEGVRRREELSRLALMSPDAVQEETL